MSGIIGEITHLRSIQSGNDEIKFSTPITNTSEIERCYVLKLYDQAGSFIYSDPEMGVTGWGTANRILPGATETMIIDSNWSTWHLGDVNNQLVRFDLVSIPTGMLGYCDIFIDNYTLVDSKTFKVPLYKDEPGEAEKLTDKLIILVAVIVLAMLVAKFS